VLGALLQDNGAWDHIGDLLQPRQFYHAAHALIFDVVGALLSACKPADIITVHSQLERLGKVEDAGGLSYLNSLVQYQPSAANGRAYARIVADRAMQRHLAEAADRVRELAIQRSDLTVAERVDRAQAELQAVQVTSGRTMPTAIRESVVAMLDRIQKRHDGTESRGISTGISDLDQLLGGGLKGGNQVIVAARPSARLLYVRRRRGSIA
jgi:replicative DNA helicase